jgi:hypothetical protein
MILAEIMAEILGFSIWKIIYNFLILSLVNFERNILIIDNVYLFN